jgi:hypothetical protein
MAKQSKEEIKNKVGRPRLLSSPEEFWDLFERYVEWTKLNPVIKRELSGRTGQVVEIPIDRPLTIDGFLSFCWGRVGNVEHYLLNTNGAYSDFLSISIRIKSEIRDNQVSGGVAGLYNANLTARLNGLTEKVQNEITTPGTISIKFEKDTE